MVFRKHTFGLICVAVTYLCIGYADYIVTVHFIGGSMSYSVWGMMNIIFYNVVLGLLVISHIRAMTSDPGLISTMPSKQHEYMLVNSEAFHQHEAANDYTVCARCDAIRPPRAYHCQICARCVKRMVHHCPWINNCIGELNQKYLLMFVFYVVLVSIYSATMISIYWILHPPHLSSHVLHHKMFHSCLLAGMCILFSLFSVAVGYDQLVALRTYRERVSGTSLPTQTKLPAYVTTTLLNKQICYEIFGDIHPMLWLIPLNLSRRKASGLRQPLIEA